MPRLPCPAKDRTGFPASLGSVRDYCLPVPVNATFWGLPRASSVNIKCPWRLPGPRGVKVTRRVQFDPASREPWRVSQVEPGMMVKSPSRVDGRNEQGLLAGIGHGQCLRLARGAYRLFAEIQRIGGKGDCGGMERARSGQRHFERVGVSVVKNRDAAAGRAGGGGLECDFDTAGLILGERCGGIGQLLVWLKPSPASVILSTRPPALPVLSRVIVWGSLVLPTATSPKSTA